MYLGRLKLCGPSMSLFHIALGQDEIEGNFFLNNGFKPRLIVHTLVLGHDDN